MKLDWFCKKRPENINFTKLIEYTISTYITKETMTIVRMFQSEL